MVDEAHLRHRAGGGTTYRGELALKVRQPFYVDLQAKKYCDRNEVAVGFANGAARPLKT